MVLVCGYCRKLNYTPAGKNLAIHKDLGIGLPVVNYRESWYRTTIVQNVIKARFHQEEVEEEKRPPKLFCPLGRLIRQPESHRG